MWWACPTVVSSPHIHTLAHTHTPLHIHEHIPHTHKTHLYTQTKHTCTHITSSHTHTHNTHTHTQDWSGSVPRLPPSSAGLHQPPPDLLLCCLHRDGGPGFHSPPSRRAGCSQDSTTWTATAGWGKRTVSWQDLMAHIDLHRNSAIMAGHWMGIWWVGNVSQIQANESNVL